MFRRRTCLVFCLLAAPLFAAEREPGVAFAVAIESHDVDAIKALLAAGNSTETPIVYGEHSITPLLKAAWDGDQDIVATLLAAGAKVKNRIKSRPKSAGILAY